MFSLEDDDANELFITPKESLFEYMDTSQNTSNYGIFDQKHDFKSPYGLIVNAVCGDKSIYEDILDDEIAFQSSQNFNNSK